MPPQDDDSELPFEDRWQQRQQAVDRALARLKRRQRSRHRYSSRTLLRSQQDLQQVRQQFIYLKQELEDYAFSIQNIGKNLSEPFWMAVRFGGLGIIIGWVLCWSYLGGSRQEERSRQTGSTSAVGEVVNSLGERTGRGDA
ncbi:MAG: hypothetical protein AAFY11_04240 [Cyanobacteria bacterium J06641_5]